MSFLSTLEADALAKVEAAVLAEIAGPIAVALKPYADKVTAELSAVGIASVSAEWAALLAKAKSFGLDLS